MPPDGRHQPTRQLPRPTRRLLWTILLLCGTGAYFSGEAVSRQANLWAGAEGSGGWLGRLCDATAAWGLDCAATAPSPWSRFDVPVPVPSSEGLVTVHRVRIPLAFLGLAYFVFLGTWFLFVARADLRHAPRWPVYVTRGGGVFSVGCLVLMAARVAPPCVLCALVHGANLILAWAVAKLYRPSAAPVAEEEVARRRFAKRQARCAACFAAILIVGLWLYRREQLALGRRVRAYQPYRAMVKDLRADPDFLRWEYHHQPFWSGADENGAENTNAPRLTVFTDFQCPNCVCADRRIQRLAAPSFAGRLRVNVRHFPLDSACNETVKETRHPQACEAAYAAEAARMQGGDQAFNRMKALLFGARKSLRPRLYAKLAERAGLDVERFRRDMAGEPVRAVVRRDIALAKRLGVTGTPTVYLNGRRVTAFGLDNPVYWRTLADDWFAEHDTTRFGAVDECWDARGTQP